MCPGSMQPTRWSTEHRHTKEPFQQRRLSVAPGKSNTPGSSTEAVCQSLQRRPGDRRRCLGVNLHSHRDLRVAQDLHDLAGVHVQIAQQRRIGAAPRRAPCVPGTVEVAWSIGVPHLDVKISSPPRRALVAPVRGGPGGRMGVPPPVVLDPAPGQPNHRDRRAQRVHPPWHLLRAWTQVARRPGAPPARPDHRRGP
jgi:hypothetical protein